MQSTFRRIGKASCSALCAGALAASMIVMPAGSAWADDSHPPLDGDQYVSCSPTPFAAAWPEYLGMNTTDERWGIDDADNGQAGTLEANISNVSGALRYLLMGTEYNVNPNAYMWNTVYDTDGKKVIPNSKRSAYSSTNMNRALGFYGSADSDDAIWDMKPDVIMGVATTSNTTFTDYTAEVAEMAAADSAKFGNYHPVAVNANVSSSQVELFYTLADAANKAKEASGKDLRYGDPVALAKNYEGVYKGSQGYVLARLDKEGADKKSVVFVSANDGTNVTLDTGFESNFQTTLENVAVNWADTKAAGEEKYTIPIAELEAAVNGNQIDLVILNTGDYNRDGFVETKGLENLYGKMYWVADADCGTVGCDNRGPSLVVNYGRILGCLYPEYIDQSDWVAYTYDTIFHVKSDRLNDAINRAMDGVRNWDVTSGSGNDYLQWTENTCADYNQAEVKELIDYGLAYVKAQGDDASESLQITDRLVGEVGTYAEMTDPAEKPAPAETVAVYRVYNPNSGEHFYTTSTVERDNCLANGWNDENIGWYAPAANGVQVYRLYNAIGGEHHYTLSAVERDNLVANGWTEEANGWTSDPNETVALLRQYNPNEFANNHNYTTSQFEHDSLIGLGWNNEGIAWYAVAGV